MKKFPNVSMVFALMAVVIAILGAKVLSQDKAPAAPAEEFPSLTPLRGLDVGVREQGETKFTEKTPTIAVEAYKDEDFGTLAYVTKTGSIAVLPHPSNFEVRVLPFVGYYEAIRFSPISGQAWRLDLRTSTWQAIKDSAKLTPGNYEVDMFSISADNSKENVMVAMRVDQFTGQTWTLTNDEWVLLNEPAQVKK